MSPLRNRRPPSYSAKMRVTDCHQYCQARSATCWPTRTLAHTYRLWRTRWKSSGKHVGGAKNKHGVVLIWSRRAEERGVVLACRYGPVLQILQNGFGQGPFLVQTVLLSELCSARFEPKTRGFLPRCPL